MDDQNFISDGIVAAGGKVVGLFLPSTIIGTDGNEIYINGKDGIASFDAAHVERFWEALIKSGSILFGSEDEVAACSSHLRNPRLSRTCSYLCTESSNCADFLTKLGGICSSRVVIIGCGGIGSLAAMNIVGAGVAQITLVDHDTIEESNLNRQFFWTRHDIGLRKVNTLEKAILERYPDAEVKLEHSQLNISNLVSLADAHDVCIVTADEPLGISAELARSTRTFVISGSYFHGYSGYFARSAPRRAHSPSIRWTRSPHFTAPSFGPANTEIAGVVSSACLNYLANRASLRHIDISHVWRTNRMVGLGAKATLKYD